MAFQTKKGTFTTIASGPPWTIAITGVGFQPKGILFFTAPDAGASGVFTDGAHMTVGWCDESTVVSGVQNGVASRAGDNQSPVDTCYQGNSSYPILAQNLNETVALEVRVVSLDADGFSVYYNTFGGFGGKVVHYLAFGGDYSVDVNGSTAWGNSSGPQSVTPSTLGFQPACQISYDSIATAAGSYDGWSFGFGAAGETTSGITQGAVAVQTVDAANPTNLYHYQRSTQHSVGLSAAGALKREGSITAFSNGGITFNWGTGGTGMVGGLSLGGTNLRAQVVPVTQPTATGSQVISGLTIAPLFVLLFSAGATASASIVNGAFGLSLGVSDGTSQGVAWTGDTHNVATSVNASYQSTTQVFIAATPAATGSASTILAAASLTSINGDGFTLNWTTADSTQREILALVVGTSATVEVAPGIGESFGPLVWAEWDGSDGTRRYWGPVDLPDPSTYYGGYKSPKLLTAGTVIRSLSDEDGQLQSQRFEVDVIDVDRELRTLLGRADARRILLNTPLVLRMISDEDRRLQLVPRTVAIGVVRDYRLH